MPPWGKRRSRRNGETFGIIVYRHHFYDKTCAHGYDHDVHTRALLSLCSGCGDGAAQYFRHNFPNGRFSPEQRISCSLEQEIVHSLV